jgi:hypothetical protein
LNVFLVFYIVALVASQKEVGAASRRSKHEELPERGMSVTCQLSTATEADIKEVEVKGKKENKIKPCTYHATMHASTGADEQVISLSSLPTPSVGEPTC